MLTLFLISGVSAHAIRMHILSENITKNGIIVKGRVYFPGFGPAINTPVYAYAPNCTSSICPPECKAIAETKTNKYGYFTLRIPLVNGTIKLAAVHDPAHVVCEEIVVKLTGKGKAKIEVKSGTLFTPLFTEERFGPYAVYYAFATGVAILLAIAAIAKVIMRQRSRR